MQLDRLEFTRHSFKNNSNLVYDFRLDTYISEKIEIIDLRRNQQSQTYDKEKFSTISKNFIKVRCKVDEIEENIGTGNLFEYGLTDKRFNNLKFCELATDCFYIYLDGYKRSNTFKFYRNKQTNKVVRIKLKPKYHKDYAKKIEKRGKYLAYEYRNARSVLITLTVDPKLYDYDLFRMWEDVTGKGSQYNRFMTNLRKHFKKMGKPFPPYIATIEAMGGQEKNEFIGKGLPHIHICFLGVSRIMDWRKIRDLWGIGGIWINKTKQGMKVRKPIDYVIKYVTKTYSHTTEKNKLTQALTWLFHCRTFMTSRGLVFPLSHVSEESLYEPLLSVTVSSSYDENLLNRVGSLLEEYLDRPPTFPLSFAVCFHLEKEFNLTEIN